MRCRLYGESGEGGLPGGGAAAEQEDVESQYKAGLSCSPENKTEDVPSWYQAAARQGHAVASAAALACCYANGDGVEADVEQARGWFTKAAAQGLSEAAILLEQF